LKANQKYEGGEEKVRKDSPGRKELTTSPLGGEEKEGKKGRTIRR